MLRSTARRLFLHQRTSTSRFSQPPGLFDISPEALSSVQRWAELCPMTYELAMWRGQRILLAEVDLAVSEQSSVETEDVRTPSDSMIEIHLPFSSNENLRKRYSLFEENRPRFGLLLEDIDALASDVSYRHCRHRDQYILVTACLDRISGRWAHMSLQEDLLLRGQVTWVGNSSLEVTIKVFQGDKSGEARLLFVARDPDTDLAKRVPRLMPITPEEKQAERDGARANEKRQQLRLHALDKEPPNGEESAFIHQLHLRRGGTPVGETEVRSFELMHGQSRNIHGRAFGGTLMKHAYESAWTCAYMAMRKRPECLAVDDVNFTAPVEIGDIVEYKARLAYATPSSVHVLVDAEVVDAQKGTRTLTNRFLFSFNGDETLNIVPETYSDAVHMIEARRRLQSHESE
ncbi:MAG: hypothetical protein MHM6MM_002240 [Cercozoa sp. M6MM]